MRARLPLPSRAEVAFFIVGFFVAIAILNFAPLSEIPQ